MIEFSGDGILLDIEGTTSSVRFVYDVMFPFVREHLEHYLQRHWTDSSLAQACRQVATDAGHGSLGDWFCECTDDQNEQQRLVKDEVLRQMDADAKVTGLKMLQGLIWQAGFERGDLVAHVYDDVVPALDAWNASAKDIRIYSSGSVQAQQLFFGHTEQGNLLNRFRGHYDTRIGPKKEPASYRKIADDFRLDAAEILFLSDIVAELNAAAQAGMKTGLCLRPENAPVAEGHNHPEFKAFSDIRVS